MLKFSTNWNCEVAVWAVVCRNWIWWYFLSLMKAFGISRDTKWANIQPYICLHSLFYQDISIIHNKIRIYYIYTLESFIKSGLQIRNFDGLIFQFSTHGLVLWNEEMQFRWRLSLFQKYLLEGIVKPDHSLRVIMNNFTCKCIFRGFSSENI